MLPSPLCTEKCRTEFANWHVVGAEEHEAYALLKLVRAVQDREQQVVLMGKFVALLRSVLVGARALVVPRECT